MARAGDERRRSSPRGQAAGRPPTARRRGDHAADRLVLPVLATIVVLEAALLAWLIAGCG